MARAVRHVLTDHRRSCCCGVGVGVCLFPNSRLGRPHDWHTAPGRSLARLIFQGLLLAALGAVAQAQCGTHNKYDLAVAKAGRTGTNCDLLIATGSYSCDWNFAPGAPLTYTAGQMANLTGFCDRSCNFNALDSGTGQLGRCNTELAKPGVTCASHYAPGTPGGLGTYTPVNATLVDRYQAAATNALDAAQGAGTCARYIAGGMTCAQYFVAGRQYAFVCSATCGTACAQLIHQGFTCAGSFAPGQQYGIGGFAVARATTNALDDASGNGTCAMYIAQGMTCSQHFSSGAQYAGYCDVLCGYLRPPNAFGYCDATCGFIANITNAQGSCDFACGFCNTTRIVQPPRCMVKDQLDKQIANGECAAGLAQGMYTCADTHVGSSRHGQCNLACEMNFIEHPQAYSTAVNGTVTNTTIHKIAMRLQKEWWNIRNDSSSLLPGCTQSVKTTCFNLYDQYQGAGQCDALIRSGWSCQGNF
jgi:hypothetical protein